MLRFQSRTILVTGAGSGIGAATVRRILEEGGQVAAADIRAAVVEKVRTTAAVRAVVGRSPALRSLIINWSRALVCMKSMPIERFVASCRS